MSPSTSTPAESVSAAHPGVGAAIAAITESPIEAVVESAVGGASIAAIAAPAGGCAAIGSAGGGALVGQGDADVEHVVLAVLDQVHLDRIDVDADVLADHFQQLALQQRQVVRRAAAAALLGDDDAQPLLGDRGGVFLRLEEIEHAHASTSEQLAEETLLLQLGEAHGPLLADDARDRVVIGLAG